MHEAIIVPDVQAARRDRTASHLPAHPALELVDAAGEALHAAFRYLPQLRLLSPPSKHSGMTLGHTRRGQDVHGAPGRAR